MIARREFITMLGGAAAAWPVVAWGQQAAMPVVGFLNNASSETEAVYLGALHDGVVESGFVVGQTVAFEYRWAENSNDRLSALAAELVRRQVTVIAATGNEMAARAAKAATSTIPIVFANGSDPVNSGLVQSVSRPGGNATGVTFFVTVLHGKRLELLRELIPQAETMAFLTNPNSPRNLADIAEVELAARHFNQRMVILKASTAAEIDAAFVAAAEQRAAALLVNGDVFFNSRRTQLALLAARHRIPTGYASREFVRAGGLISYGDKRLDSWRHAGLYVGRILKGEKPADLPVVQPTKFELVINLSAAKALGLEIPPTLLARADEVIE
jgi:putative ABC transport system substrate-binding protein